ncbi:PTS fructose transporter subunit IIC [Belnapia rosea]|uniref:protein-N(pi)-phosphohistidine--D-fructose phosphotransferase n=1 Tax=Belnapia rosea TaxID=938405 RepID=A0A1G6R3L3_9PROT|nr:fructose-specific PTS transporter subunit EIIC [Belnapia rosea]SDC98864.1 PTS system D-fructose-specific IIB component (F1P-forming), Frc family /PTS system D-fructose-specific IIC component (F1P-forming), Frc family [Belnapia rosea]
MSRIIAVVEAGGNPVQAMLAAEALRQAARRGGRDLAVEVRTERGVISPLPASPTADALLLVGEAAAPAGLAGMQAIHAGIAEVLADPAGVLARLDGGVPAPAAARGQRIVAITSCPTGIAHTFMAAEGLEGAAKALGHQIRVETQGSVGAQNALTPEEIAAADLVLIAADTQVDLSRFGAKRVFLSGTKAAINDGQALVTRALAEATEQGGAQATASAAPAAGKRSLSGPYKHLMTGVSFMLPFTVAGGLLIALAFALGGIYAFDDAHRDTLAGALFQIGGKAALALMVPALGGYIAYSIADRPGIAPGMIGGMIAAQLNAGFLGGIVAGFVAGYSVTWLNRALRLPRTLEGLKPVLILPVLGALITGLALIYVAGGPVAVALAWLTEFLRGMQGSGAILLGLLLGGMMAFDMGGPVNKAAYAFSTGLLASQVYSPMAAAMVAGMVPPLGLALAAFLFRDRFTPEEREAAPAAGVLGLAFISEGAIPFAAKDPLRVIPALVAGSAVAGAISMAVGAELRVPHGGVFVLPIPNAVSQLGGYVVALLAGTVVTALALRLLKRPAVALA